MKSTFLLLIIFLFSSQVVAQVHLIKPTLGQVQSATGIPPGTVKIRVSPLKATLKDNSCRQGLKQVGIKVLEVMAEGSGLVRKLNQGDSLKIRILNGMDFSVDNLADRDVVLLKEQLCYLETTYFSLVKKE